MIYHAFDYFCDEKTNPSLVLMLANLYAETYQQINGTHIHNFSHGKPSAAKLD